MTNEEILEDVTKRVLKSKRLGKGEPYKRKIESAKDLKACLAVAIRQVLTEGKSEKYGILSSLCNSFSGIEKLQMEQVENKEILKRLKELERS
jgi:hypothetical protein